MEISQRLMYLLLVLIPLIIIVVFDLWIGERVLRKKRSVLVLGAFTALMLIFDTYLTSLPIVTYSEEKILGFRIGSIPVEDFLYGYTALILLPNAGRVYRTGRKFGKTLFLSSRPFSWLNTSYPAALGVLLAQGSFQIRDIALLLFFFFPYNLIMYGINDVFDFATDQLNARKGTIDGARIVKDSHSTILFTSGVVLLIFTSLFIMMQVSFYFFAIYVLTCINAIIYSAPPRLKTIPFLDSISSSLHFVLPFICGVVWIGGENIGIYFFGVLGFFAWGIASHMLGALPDIPFDKKVGDNTIGVMMGQRHTAYLSTAFYIISAVFFFFNQVPLFLILLILPYIINAFLASFKTSLKTRKHFRFFMYYNLFVGFVVTLYLIFFLSNLWLFN